MPNELLNDHWQACERHCRAFESAWQGGAPPAIEDHLPADESGLRQAVLSELVHLDLEFRLRRGIPARVEDYLQRYPHLRGSEALVLELIEEEYALRLETEHGLSPTEYVERFPRLAEELAGRLSKTRVGDFSLRAPAERSEPAVPIVPGCEILELLGRGGMGVVYKAHQVALDRIVAVKVLNAGAGADDEQRDRFQAETRAVALLQHPNIVQIYEVGAVAGQPYCLLEYVAGGSLQRKLADGPMPARLAAELVEPLARALQCAHERGVIHRDVKPGNILLQSDQKSSIIPKLSDFGLAKRLEQKQSLTETGAVLGTVQYMAPEQAAGSAAGPAADIYSLGAVLYEMCTGRPPLHGASAFETIQMLMEVDPVPPARLQPNVPRDLETICMTCLHKSPARRYATAAQVADDLKRFLAGEAILARPVGAVERAARWCRRRPAQALSLALLVLVVVGAAAAGFWYQQRQAKDLADEATRLADARQKHELATQQVADALAQGRQLQDRLRADLARPGGVFLFINKSAEWDGQIRASRAALERARAVVTGADGTLDSDLLRQVKSLDDQLREDDAQRDLAIALEKIRLDRSAWTEDGFDLAGAEREYARVFAEAGLWPAGADRSTNVPGMEHIRRVQNSPIREQLLASLDDWAYVAWSRNNQELAAQVLQMARLVDPHPWRDQVRVLPAWNNVATLEKLAGQAQSDQELFDSLSPQMLHLMGRLLFRLDFVAAPKGKKSTAGPVQKKSEAWLRQAQQRHLGDFWLNFQLGLLLKPTQPSEAAGFYRTALVVRPHSSAAWNNYGVILRAQQNIPDALRACRKAVDCEPRNFNALYNLARCLIDAGNHAEARAICDKQIELQTASASSLNNLGLSLYALRDFAGAKDAFNKAIAIDARYVQAWTNLGRTLRTEGKVADAVKVYQKATEIEPQSAKAWSGLAGVHLDRKQWASASRTSKQAIELDPDNAVAWARLGHALREQNDVAGAIKAFERALEIEPGNADAWTALGIVLRRSGKLPAAIKAHRKALEINPNTQGAWTNLSVALRATKDLPGAADALRIAVDLNPKDAVAWGTLAAIYHELNELTKSADAYRTCLALNSRNNVLWYHFGVVLRKKRELRPAAEAFEKSIALNAKTINPHYELVTVYRDLGRFEQALKACDRGIATLSLIDGLQLTVLRVELVGLISQEKRLAKVLAGDKATPLELVELADLCQRYQGRYRDAVRLYAEALDARPQLADSLLQKRRYFAARAALLAADGKDTDTPPLDAAAQARYRQQALTWLRADLAQYAKLMQGGSKSEIAAVREFLTRWSIEPEFGLVRDAKKQALLPPAECKAWQQLWSEVDMLRKLGSPAGR